MPSSSPNVRHPPQPFPYTNHTFVHQSTPPRCTSCPMNTSPTPWRSPRRSPLTTSLITTTFFRSVHILPSILWACSTYRNPLMIVTYSTEQRKSSIPICPPRPLSRDFQTRRRYRPRRTVAPAEISRGRRRDARSTV